MKGQWKECGAGYLGKGHRGREMESDGCTGKGHLEQREHGEGVSGVAGGAAVALAPTYIPTQAGAGAAATAWPGQVALCSQWKQSQNS